MQSRGMVLEGPTTYLASAAKDPTMYSSSPASHITSDAESRGHTRVRSHLAAQHLDSSFTTEFGAQPRQID